MQVCFSTNQFVKFMILSKQKCSRILLIPTSWCSALNFIMCLIKTGLTEACGLICYVSAIFVHLDIAQIWVVPSNINISQYFEAWCRPYYYQHTALFIQQQPLQYLDSYILTFLFQLTLMRILINDITYLLHRNNTRAILLRNARSIYLMTWRQSDTIRYIVP